MENKTKYFVIGGIVLALITGSILAFIFLNKNKTNEPVTLSWWGFEEKNDGLQLLIDEYQKKHSNVTIEYVQKGENAEEYERFLNDALAAGTGPDLFATRNDWTPKYYSKLSEMPEDIYKLDDFKNTFFEIAYRDLSKDDKIYAMPFHLDTLGVFYNKKLVNSRKPGDTWDEFKESVKKYRKLKGDYIEIAGATMGTSDNIEYAEDILYMIMLQNHTTMLSDDLTQAYFNLSAKDKYGNITYPGTSALSFYTSFSDPNKETYTWNTKMNNSFATFTDGKSATMFGYAKDIARIEKATNEELNFETVKAPQVLGNELYLAKYWAHGVSKDSKNQETAWDFLKTSSEKNINIDYVNKIDLPSARKDVAKTQHNIRIKPFIEQLENATSWHKGDWLKADKLFRNVIKNVSTGKQKAQAAIDDAAKQMNNILKEVE